MNINYRGTLGASCPFIPESWVELSTVDKLSSTAREAQVIWNQVGEIEADIETTRQVRMTKKGGALGPRGKNDRCHLSVPK